MATTPANIPLPVNEKKRAAPESPETRVEDETDIKRQKMTIDFGPSKGLFLNAAFIHPDDIEALGCDDTYEACISFSAYHNSNFRLHPDLDKDDILNAALEKSGREMIRPSDWRLVKWNSISYSAVESFIESELSVLIGGCTKDDGESYTITFALRNWRATIVADGFDVKEAKKKAKNLASIREK